MEKETEKNWCERHRPTDVDSIVGNANIMRVMDGFYKSGNIPHTLFYGPPGTGKTTTALCMVERFHGKNFKSMVMIFNASHDGGIDLVRQEIKNFCTNQTLHVTLHRTKFIILDEVDHWSKIAQFALRRVIEIYEKTARFILICNYVNKVDYALRSRTCCFRFRPLDSLSVSTQLDRISKKEHIDFVSSSHTLRLIADMSKGDLRRGISLLQIAHTQAKYQKIPISNSIVYQMTSNISENEIEQVLSTLYSETIPFQQKVKNLDKLPCSFCTFIVDLHDYLISHIQIYINLPKPTFSSLLIEIAAIEYRFRCVAGSDYLQKGSLAALFF